MKIQLQFISLPQLRKNIKEKGRMQITELLMYLYIKRFIKPEIAPCIIIIGSKQGAAYIMNH